MDKSATDHITDKLFGPTYASRKSQPGSATLLLNVVEDVLFGEVYNRPNLRLEERCMITLAALTALNREEQLRAHIAAANRVGVGREQIIEIMIQTAFYAGMPAGMRGLRILDEVFAESHKGSSA